MARTILTKRLTQIRDIDYVRALLKTAAVMAPNSGLSLPTQLPGLPKPPGLTPGSPTAGNPYRVAPPTPAVPPAQAMARTPEPAPAPMGQPPALSRQSPVTPSGLNPQSLQVNPGETASLPPATAAAPLNPQPQPTNLPPQQPGSAITPPTTPEPDMAPPAPMPTAPTVTRPPEATEPPAQPQQPAPLSRQQPAKPTETDGRMLNKQLETAAKEKWGPKLQNAKTQEDINAIAREAAPEIKRMINPETLKQHSQALQDLDAGKVDTPAVKRLMTEQVGPAGDKFIEDATARAKAVDPYGFGAATATATNMWKSLGSHGQIAFAMGVPLALVGMFGNSGMASMLGMLGLGAAGGFATLNGAFGEEPAKLVEGLLGGAAKTVGVNTPSRENYEKRIRDASMKSQAAGNAEVQKVQKELQGLSFLPSARAGLREIGPNPQQYLYDKARGEAAGKMSIPRNVYNYAMPDAVQALPGLARRGIASLPESLRGAVQQYVPDSAIDKAEAAVKPTKDDAADAALWWNGWKKPAAARDYNKEAAYALLKAARCWSGYEPVPGAKAYSEGSCRPKGSKKTKKEVIQGKKHTEKKSRRA